MVDCGYPPEAYSCPVQETLCVILLLYNYTAQSFITAPTITSLFDTSHLPSRHVGHTHTHSHNADTHSLVPRLYIWRSQGPRLDTHTQFRHTTHHVPGKIREFLGSSATLLRDFSIVSASPSKILPTDNQRDLTQNPMPSCHSNT